MEAVTVFVLIYLKCLVDDCQYFRERCLNRSSKGKIIIIDVMTQIAGSSTFPSS